MMLRYFLVKNDHSSHFFSQIFHHIIKENRAVTIYGPTVVEGWGRLSTKSVLGLLKTVTFIRAHKFFEGGKGGGSD